MGSHSKGEIPGGIFSAIGASSTSDFRKSAAGCRTSAMLQGIVMVHGVAVAGTNLAGSISISGPGAVNMPMHFLLASNTRGQNLSHSLSNIHYCFHDTREHCAKLGPKLSGK